MGVDGLKMRYLPELAVRDREVVFTKIPTMVIVRNTLRARLGKEACESRACVQIVVAFSYIIH